MRSRQFAPRGGRRRHRRRGRRLFAIAAAGCSIAALAAVAVDEPVNLKMTGVDEAEVLGKAAVEGLLIELDASGIGAADVEVKLNGTSVGVERVAGKTVARPGPLVRHGLNEVEARVHGRFLFADHVVKRQFTAVLTSAAVAVPTQTLRPSDGGPVVVKGLVEDAVALEVNGRSVPIEGDAFATEVSAGEPTVVVRALHANGNATEKVVAIVDAATPPSFPETRAVHISARGWADPAIRTAILDLARAGAINAVQLDIKDESGEIGYMSSVQLANAVGSVRSHYDPKLALDELHDLGVRVIGRVVCFLDPVAASWAWSSGRTDMVVQSADGAGPLDNNYGHAAFTNFASADVQKYLIDLSVEAAAAGFDEILYDYVRRPEGKLETMAIPGLARAPEVEIARFVRDTKAALQGYEVELGVSVFGIAASRPRQIAQDMHLLAPHVDYIAPMVYPSHWGRGEYGVESPIRQPGDIVSASLRDFHAVTAGSGAAIVPWLQAFSAGGVTYGPAQVHAQIKAARDVGASGFLLWNAGSVYDAGALAPVG